MMVQSKSAADDAEENLLNLLKGMRLDVTREVIVSESKPFAEVLKENSAETDLIFLGLAKPHDGYHKYYEEFKEMTTGLPTILYVLAGQDVDFTKVLK